MLPAYVEATAVVLGVFVVAGLVLLAGLSLLASVVRTRRKRRRGEVRSQVSTDILDLVESEADAAAWADGLDSTERDVAVEVVESYLRQLEGGDRDAMASVARGLGLHEQALSGLDSRLVDRRLHALKWLTLLEVEVDDDHLRERCRDHPETRAAAARYLHDTDRQAEATELLVGGDEALSVFALDTLYQANRRDMRPLLAATERLRDEWSEVKLVQVLQVVAHCESSVSGPDVNWIVDLLEHGSAEVRAAALRAVLTKGWQDDIRRSVDWSRFEDDERSVRRALYEVLDAWGDMGSLALLADLAGGEPDDRLRLLAVEALYHHGASRELGLSPDYARTWDWVEAREAT